MIAALNWLINLPFRVLAWWSSRGTGRNPGGAVLVTRLVLVAVFFAIPIVPFAGVYWWLVRKYDRGDW